MTSKRELYDLTPPTPRWIRAVVALLLSGLAMAGCSFVPDRSQLADQNNPSRPGSLRARGVATPGVEPPRLVALRAVKSAGRRRAAVARAGSPRAAVTRLRRWIVIGAPTLPLLYDSEVKRYLGSRLILRSLAPLKGQSSRARVTQDRVDGGAIVEVTTSNPGAPSVDRYFVVRSRGSWVIRYDSALTAQIGQQVLSSSGPDGAPSEATVARGEKTKDAVVSRFVPKSLVDRLTAP